MKGLVSIIAIFILGLTTGSVYAQCTPDATLQSTGTRPNVLSNANVGVPYSQIIHYFIVKDTMVYVPPPVGQTLNTSVDTLWITGIVGLPDGFTYACHNSDCKILGGTTGCATITGTPKTGSAGIYPLLVLIRIRATAMLGPLPISQTVNDTNARYSLVVNYPSGKAELYGADELLVYPNPSREEIQIKVPSGLGNSQMEITDLEGKLLLEHSLTASHEVNKVDIRGLKSGLYILRVQAQGKVLTRKFAVTE